MNDENGTLTNVILRTVFAGVMRVAGPAVLSFGAIIGRTSHTNQAGVWICRHMLKHMLKYGNDFKLQW